MTVKTFTKGIHTEEHKEKTSGKRIVDGPVPHKVILPLQQHAGAVCEPLVEPKEEVLVGQKIGDSKAFIAAPIHSSVSGKVKAIEPCLHHSGLKLPSIVIESDGDQREIDYQKPRQEPDQAEIRQLARQAGLVGLGGAAFPTHVKLTPPEDCRIDSVLINGCECEPYLTSDHRLMLEESESIIDGLSLIKKAVGAEKGYIGIETNKPDAIEKMRQAVSDQDDTEVIALETKYPQGAEKQLIEAVLNRKVPPRALPSAVGALVQNVATSIALSKAVREGRPLTTKVITVSGGGIKDPKNIRVLIGTQVSDVIEACGGLSEGVEKIVFGGPMMGVTLAGEEVPVVKATSAVIALAADEISSGEIQPCIKCGRCVDACPMGLAPNRLGSLAEFEIWEELKENNVFDCVECGSCAFICPARRPLVQYIKLGKYALAKEEQKEAKTK